MKSSLSLTAIITATLLTPTVGCWASSTDDCEGGTAEGEFTITDRMFTAEDYELATDTSWAEIAEADRCEAACRMAYDDAYWESDEELTSITTCEFTPTVADDPAMGGTVSCAGTTVREILCVGRRPLRIALAEAEHFDIGAYLDAIVTLEALAVVAFEQLASQLENFDAPAELIARCRSATADERRHVALLEELGARVGVAAGTGDGHERGPASLFEIALHNASEGCVAETWAALLAAHQAEHAEDPRFRPAHAVIASDEARHGELAWALHQWFCQRVSAAEAAQIEAARLAALAELPNRARTQALRLHPDARRRLGLPDPRRAAALAGELARRLPLAA